MEMDRIVATRMEDGELLFNRQFQFDEKVLGMDDGGGCRTLGMYLMPQNCILKNYIFYVMSNFNTLKKRNPFFIQLTF